MIVALLAAFAAIAYIISQGVGSVMSGGNTDAVSLARELIKGFESWSPTAYPDPPGQSQSFSIGWGHNIIPGDNLSAQSVLTRQQGDALLELDMQKFVSCVESNVTVPMSAPMEAALISFCYNEGCAAFTNGGPGRGPSGLLVAVNAQDWASIAGEFSKWTLEHVNGQAVHSQALADRRTQEANYFSSGLSSIPSTVSA